MNGTTTANNNSIPHRKRKRRIPTKKYKPLDIDEDDVYTRKKRRSCAVYDELFSTVLPQPKGPGRPQRKKPLSIPLPQNVNPLPDCTEGKIQTAIEQQCKYKTLWLKLLTQNQRQQQHRQSTTPSPQHSRQSTTRYKKHKQSS
eukprot:UN32204